MKTLRYIVFSLIVVFCHSLYAADKAEPVNINTADAATLSASLIGVGASKAKAIVAYRNNYGPFQAIEELKAVKGIGESLLEKNHEHILLK